MEKHREGLRTLREREGKKKEEKGSHEGRDKKKERRKNP